MPRCARPTVAGAALHVIQRGNNRAACFFSDSDRLAYLTYLRQSAAQAGCAVHAYCLMTNYTHLLVTAVAGERAASAMMKRVGQLYAQYFNRVHARTGTLWEGRFRSCIAASERYVLACYRYIELNPVRAEMVTHPRLYPWSSYRHNAEGRADSLVVPHPTWEGLADDRDQRLRAYRDIVESGMEPDLLGEIRSAIRGNRALGTPPGRRGRKKMGSVPIF